LFCHINNLLNIKKVILYLSQLNLRYIIFMGKEINLNNPNNNKLKRKKIENQLQGIWALSFYFKNIQMIQI